MLTIFTGRAVGRSTSLALRRMEEQRLLRTMRAFDEDWAEQEGRELFGIPQPEPEDCFRGDRRPFLGRSVVLEEYGPKVYVTTFRTTWDQPWVVGMDYGVRDAAVTQRLTTELSRFEAKQLRDRWLRLFVYPHQQGST